MGQTSNIGEVGIRSIRIAGHRVEDLPLGMGNEAKAQIPLALDMQRQQKIAGVLKKFPTGKRVYYESRVKEANSNIVGFGEQRVLRRKWIGEYRATLQQIDGVPNVRELEDEIFAVSQRTDIDLAEKTSIIHNMKEGHTTFVPEAMVEQMTQYETDIERYDIAIQEENDAIGLLSQTIGLVELRDFELRNLGVAKAYV